MYSVEEKSQEANYCEKGYHFELGLFELKQTYHDDKLSGKLKELVAT